MISATVADSLRKPCCSSRSIPQHPLNGSHFQPSCEHRRPAPFARIVAQLQNEAPFIDDMEFTAWEFHSYMSPLPGPCSWAKAAAKRNGSGGLYQQYKRYVDGLFEAHPTPLKGDYGELRAPNLETRH